MAITAFLSRYPGLLNRGPGGQASLGPCPHSGISPTNSKFLCTELYCFTPTQGDNLDCRQVSTCRQSRLSPWYLRPDAPVIYTGAFPILTARPWSICNMRIELTWGLLVWLAKHYTTQGAPTPGESKRKSDSVFPRSPESEHHDRMQLCYTRSAPWEVCPVSCGCWIYRLYL